MRGMKTAPACIPRLHSGELPYTPYGLGAAYTPVPLGGSSPTPPIAPTPGGEPLWLRVAESFGKPFAEAGAFRLAHGQTLPGFGFQYQGSYPTSGYGGYGGGYGGGLLSSMGSMMPLLLIGGVALLFLRK